MFEGMPIFFQVLASGLGLAFVAVIVYTLMYIADEVEESGARFIGRIIKALFGGVLWVVVGVVVAGGLFGLAVVVRAIFFRPVISYFLFQFWAFRVGLVVVGFYVLWGIYHGAKNRLPLSFRFRRETAEIS